MNRCVPHWHWRQSVYVPRTDITSSFGSKHLILNVNSAPTELTIQRNCESRSIVSRMAIAQQRRSLRQKAIRKPSAGVNRLKKVLKSLFLLAAIAGFSLVGIANSAEARCVNCNVPISKTNVKTVVKTKTVQQVRNVTRVNNVTNNRYVKNVTRIVTRTVIVPVTRVNTVTRVHNRTFVINATQHVTGATTTGAARTIGGSNRTVMINHRPVAATQCGCRG